MFTDENREIKSKKIEAVLCDFLKTKIKGFKILDLGTGSGLIGNYFAGCNKVYYSDLEDLCGTHTKGDFLKINNNMVPYPDNSFDIIISNMVIEHTREHQKHLNEIHRLLKRGGIAYLGAPNSIYPIEPHYQIPLIHYLPQSLRLKILKFFQRFIRLRAPIEEINLPNYFFLKRELKRRFQVDEYTAKVLKNPQEFHLKFKIFRYLPLGIIRLLTPISPSNIFILKKGL